jgi:hypothetical protein
MTAAPAAPAGPATLMMAGGAFLPYPRNSALVVTTKVYVGPRPGASRVSVSTQPGPTTRRVPAERSASLQPITPSIDRFDGTSVVGPKRSAQNVLPSWHRRALGIDPTWPHL